MVKQVLNYHDVQLYDSDVALFATNQWLNDNAINFYFQYVYHTLCVRDNAARNAATASDVLLVDPAVVSCMMLQCDDDDEYADLGRGMEVHSKALCLIPVNDNQSFDSESSHWSLLVYRDGAFEHYDSSAGHNSRAAKRIAQTFLRLLWASNVADVPTWSSGRCVDVATAPQQRNGYDCGVYVLMVAEYMCRKHVNEGTTLPLREYATPARATALRREIPRIIARLQAEEKR